MPDYTTGGIQYPLAGDFIKKDSVEGKLADDMKSLALSANDAITVEGARVEGSAMDNTEAVRVARIDSSPLGVARNIVINPGPNTASPSWLVSWGAGGVGDRSFVLDQTAPSKVAYIRHKWTTAATNYAAIIRSVASPATSEAMYSGSIWVRSSIPNIMGATLSFYNEAGTQLGANVYNRLYQVSPNQWTRLDVNGYTAPTGTAFIRIGAAVNSAGAPYSTNDTLDVSAAIVTLDSRVFGYFDGTRGDAYWEGAPDSSATVAAITTPEFGAPFTNAPTHAGVSAGRYSRDRRLYLPDGATVEPLRRRIQKALDGEGSFRLAWLGHSIVAGQGGVPGVVDNVRLFQQRSAQSGVSSAGMVPAVNNTTTDARVTLDPEWASIGAPRSNMQLHRRCVVAGKQYTYASTTAGTNVEIYTFGNGSAVTYSIDGSAPVTITPTGVGAIQITTVGGLANTNHTVVITSTTTAAAYLLGVSVHATTGLRVGNFGYSGSWAADWRSDYFTSSQRFYNGYNNVFSNWAADAAIIELGANELIHGSTAGTLESNLGNMVSEATSAGKDVVLVLGTPVEDPTRTTWVKDYCPAVYRVADMYRVPLVDLTAHWISRPVAAAQDFYYDQWHPNSKGYFDLHDVMADVLLP
ncbi:SGNH/GDSL hydrolase family protein [Arthrobacter roseus]|uniref:SGNH/GDSL hydrolase family protein n=1 Tax=Arthrobacter roseus TaxID=136274 RepID=UPI0019631D56|nr:SGNH/GDSL hydrolase family protein [Arthrobacter roseus]MBM7847453.1 lysophospholipase L1-like esterase [Arthrobacter roseus]